MIHDPSSESDSPNKKAPQVSTMKGNDLSIIYSRPDDTYEFKNAHNEFLNKQYDDMMEANDLADLSFTRNLTSKLEGLQMENSRNIESKGA